MRSETSIGGEAFHVNGHEFEQALKRFPNGYIEGHFNGRRWSVTVRRSEDHRRVWFFAEELAGTDIVSFNLYALTDGRCILKPCEMSSDKVIRFVIRFKTGCRKSDQSATTSQAGGEAARP